MLSSNITPRGSATENNEDVYREGLSSYIRYIPISETLSIVFVYKFHIIRLITLEVRLLEFNLECNTVDVQALKRYVFLPHR